MSDNALGSHGALVQMTLDPSGAPGVFTTIGNIQDVPWPELSREQSQATGQEDTIGCHVSSGLLMVGSVDVTYWYGIADTTHVIGTGVLNAINENEKRGFQFIGPGGSPDAFICSGYISATGRTCAVNAGVYEGSFSMQPDGSIIIDGVALT